MLITWNIERTPFFVFNYLTSNVDIVLMLKHVHLPFSRSTWSLEVVAFWVDIYVSICCREAILWELLISGKHLTMTKLPSLLVICAMKRFVLFLSTVSKPLCMSIGNKNVLCTLPLLAKGSVCVLYIYIYAYVYNSMWVCVCVCVCVCVWACVCMHVWCVCVSVLFEMFFILICI